VRLSIYANRSANPEVLEPLTKQIENVWQEHYSNCSNTETLVDQLFAQVRQTVEVSYQSENSVLSVISQIRNRHGKEEANWELLSEDLLRLVGCSDSYRNIVPHPLFKSAQGEVSSMLRNLFPRDASAPAATSARVEADVAAGGFGAWMRKFQKVLEPAYRLAEWGELTDRLARLRTGVSSSDYPRRTDAQSQTDSEASTFERLIGKSFEPLRESFFSAYPSPPGHLLRSMEELLALTGLLQPAYSVSAPARLRNLIANFASAREAWQVRESERGKSRASLWSTDPLEVWRCELQTTVESFLGAILQHPPTYRRLD
jgi:hypothetical protein